MVERLFFVSYILQIAKSRGTQLGFFPKYIKNSF